jgi:hypothetical protein
VLVAVAVVVQEQNCQLQMIVEAVLVVGLAVFLLQSLLVQHLHRR